MRHFQLQSLARFGLALLASLALFALLETRLESRLVAGGIALLSGLALGWLGLAARALRRIVIIVPVIRGTRVARSCHGRGQPRCIPVRLTNGGGAPLANGPG